VKSIRVSAMIAVLAAVPLAAQDGPERTYGPVIGMTRTTMGGSNAEADGYESRNGFYVGFQTQRQAAGSPMFFRSGVFVARRGGLQRDTSGGTRLLNLTYIELPVLAGFNVVRGPRLQAHVLGGIQAGLGLGCSFDTKGAGLELSFKCTDPGVDFKTKTYDFSGVFGGGIGIRRATGTVITFDVTYAWGFTSIDDTDTPGDYLNRGATIAIGFRRAKQY
jgi:hypothetical protein